MEPIVPHGETKIRITGIFNTSAPVPYHRTERLSVSAAVRYSDLSRGQIIRLAKDRGIGRLVGARWQISKPALYAIMIDDREALSLYLAGEFENSKVERLFRGAGCPFVTERD